MKLYRIRYKKSFVYRTELEEVYWNPETVVATAPKIYIARGVPVEVCELVAAHWATKPVMVPEHEEPVAYTKPGFWETKATEVPGYWKDEQVYVEGHYEHKEVGFEAYIITKYKEIPGHTEVREVWVGRERVLRDKPYPGYKSVKISEDPETWVVEIPGHYERVRIWVDTIYEPYEETVPVGYKTTRVWVPGAWQIKKVWVPATIKVEKVWHEPVEIVTSVPVPAHEILESYWQEERVVCKDVYDVPQVAGMPEMTPQKWQAIEEWFRWFQYETTGQMWLRGMQKQIELGAISMKQVVLQAYETFFPKAPYLTYEYYPDAKMSIHLREAIRMLDSDTIVRLAEKQGLTDQLKRLVQSTRAPKPPEKFSEEEVALLTKLGAWAAMIAAGAVVVYWAWPFAEYEFKVTYTDWVYVLRYQETFQMADLISVSPEGHPYYLGVAQYGGPIMGEERSSWKDMWYFGEPWKWSAWHETGRWMAVREERYWYEAQVEYLGMVSRTAPNMYYLPGKVSVDAVAGHEAGWMKPSEDWGEWEEEWWHERI